MLARIVRGLDGNDVQSSKQLFRRHFKYVANAKQGLQSNRPSGLDLLPMAGGEAKREHVFLAAALFLPHGFEPCPEFFEYALMFYLTGHI